MSGKQSQGTPENSEQTNVVRKRVLLVVDEPLTRVLLRDQMTAAGLEVEEAGNGSLALKKVSSGMLDAIFIDLMLPDLLGAEVIKEARRSPDFARQPIFVCNNGVAGNGWVKRATKAGADRVFDKIHIPIHIVISEVARELLGKGNARAAQPVTLEPELNSKIREKVTTLCNQLKVVTECREEAARVAKFGRLLSDVLSVVSCTAAAGLQHLACEAAAVQSFLTELYEKPKRFNSSCLETISASALLLQEMAEDNEADPKPPPAEFSVAVLDTKMLSRRLVTKSLEDPRFKLSTFSDPKAALQYLQSNRTDLVVVELLPGRLIGPDWVAQMRQLKSQSATPVVYIANPQDFGTLAKPPTDSRTDVIVKPFIATELVLKSLSLIMKKHMRQPSTQNDSAPTKPAADTTPSPEAAPPQNETAAPDTTNEENPKKVSTSSEGMEEIKALLSSPDVGVVVIDDRKKIISANDVSAGMFGWSQLPGNDVGILLQGGLNNEFGRILGQNHPNDNGTIRFSFSLTAQAKGGKAFPADVILTRTSIGDKTSWTAVFQKGSENTGSAGNTTIQRRTASELQREWKNLASEVADQKVALQKEREALQQAETERDNLKKKVAELAESKAELENQLNEQNTSQEGLIKSFSELNEQLDDTKKEAELKETAYREQLAKSQDLNQQLNSLQQTCNELARQMASDQQEIMASKQRSEELELQLRRNTEILHRAQLDLETKANEPRPVEQELQAQLAEAKRIAEQAESGRGELAREKQRLEEKLNQGELSREELARQLTAEQAAHTSSRDSLKALESQLEEKNQAMETLRNDLENRPAPVEGDAESSVAELQRLRVANADFEAERDELDNRLRESMTSQARTTTELEKERRERHRLEQRATSLGDQLKEMHEGHRQHLESETALQKRVSELEQQLHEREEEASRLNSELQKESADRQLAEEQLQAAGEVKSQVEDYRSLFEESKETFQRSQEALKSQIETSQRSLAATKEKLQKESADRQRFEEDLNNLKRQLQEQSESNALEVSRLQSELQVEQLERKRLEGDAAQSRYASLDSARAGRSQVNTMRRQVLQPIDTILQSSRLLLEVDLPEEQKDLVQTMLENAMVIQTSIQDASRTSNTTPPTVASEGNIEKAA